MERRSSRDRDDDRGGRSSGSGRNFKYQGRTREDVQQRERESGKQFDSYLRDDIKTWKPNDGDNTIRVLPATWDGAKHYALDIWLHYGIGPDSQTYLCLERMKDEGCPICDERRRAEKDRESDDYINGLKPTKRPLIYLIDRDDEKEGVQAWGCPASLDLNITKVSVDKRSGDVLNIDDPENGFDIEFEKTGKGMTTKYVGVAIARRESALGDERWLDFVVDNPLNEILVYHDYAHIERVLNGGSRGSSKDNDRGDRDRSRDDDRSSSRERDRGTDRDDERGSSRSRRDAPSHTWDSIHKLEGNKLDDLVEAERLDIKPDDFNSDEDLQDEICRLLGIEKEEERGERSSGRRSFSNEDSDKGDSRLSRMRDRRD